MWLGKVPGSVLTYRSRYSLHRGRGLIGDRFNCEVRSEIEIRAKERCDWVFGRSR
jgi:hypothetical protein